MKNPSEFKDLLWNVGRNVVKSEKVFVVTIGVTAALKRIQFVSFFCCLIPLQIFV